MNAEAERAGVELDFPKPNSVCLSGIVVLGEERLAEKPRPDAFDGLGGYASQTKEEPGRWFVISFREAARSCEDNIN